jgi:hypothetical protein
MARTFLRQDTQVRNSDAYVDGTAPSEAAFETNPTELQTDLNNLRSQIHNVLKDAAGNWYDDLNVPSTLETGLQRGVNDLNTGLHALEKKRVLRAVKLLDDVVVTASVAATEILTLAANAANTETVTTGTKTYIFQTVLTDVDGNVLIGATASDSIDNLIAAITLGAGSGSLYAASTTANGFVTAAAGGGDTMDATALAGGTQGNSIATTETLAAGGSQWGAALMSGGAGGDVEVLATGELPTQTTAAVGAVTTLGTVVAAAGSFLTAGLDEVAGLHALSPKNLLEILDGDSGDPITTTGSGPSPAGKRIWGLLQGESGVTDGVTITDTTDTRVQISFVIANATNDDLVLVDGAEMGGKTINYCYRERIRLEDFSEGDFLNSAAIDIGAGAVTPTRQVSYDNQGTTPVDLTTNATLDLEGAGLVWAIRDDLEATLLAITEGSAGGTSEFALEAAVDTFRSDAIVNDMDNGLSVDTGSAGTTINVGVTANQIDSGGALSILSATDTDLTLFGDREVILNDENMTDEASWTGPGVKVSETTAEVVAYENAFGGEVSLMNAIVQAKTSADFDKTCANVNSTTVADTDVGGVAGGANLDAQIHDLSGGDFLTDHDVFLNGQLLRGDASGTGANDMDYYPGTSLPNGQLKFEFTMKNNDVLCVISRG